MKTLIVETNHKNVELRQINEDGSFKFNKMKTELSVINAKSILKHVIENKVSKLIVDKVALGMVIFEAIQTMSYRYGIEIKECGTIIYK